MMGKSQHETKTKNPNPKIQKYKNTKALRRVTNKHIKSYVTVNCT